MVRHYCTISLVLFAACLFAQQDTLLQSVSEVEILASRNGMQASLVTRHIPLDQRNAPLNLDLGQWLDRSGLATVNRNGAPGTAATVRFRGLSSDHTQLLWNGIPINSVALGTCDLSMFPAFLFDGLYVSEGAGVNSCLATGIGSTMNLHNVQSDSAFAFSLMGGYNSLLNQHMAADLQLASGAENPTQWSSRTKVFHQLYENKFQYTDHYQLDRPVAEQRHNNGRNFGFTQDFTIRKEHSEWKAGLWHQQRNMELPVSMGFEQNSEVFQQDAFSRACMLFRHFGTRHTWNVGYAFNNEKLHWQDEKVGSLDSRYSINGHTVNFLSDIRINRVFRFQMQAAGFYQSVLNSGYGDASKNLTCWQTGATGIFQKGIHHAEFAGRIEVRTSKIVPAYSLQYAIRPDLKDKTQKLEFQITASRKFRLPDFNEMYWNPGGNPNLLPEFGFGGIASVFYSRNFARGLALDSRIQAYYNDVQNWIQWQPVTNQYWSPVNIKHVLSRGCELQIGAAQKTKWGELQLRFNAELNLAEGQNNRDQDELWYTMIYSPRLRSGEMLRIQIRDVWFTFNHQAIAKRYTDEQNSEIRALPSYQLYHMFISKDITFSKSIATCSIGVDNAFDLRYESVRGYPIPGRVFHIQFKITI